MADRDAAFLWETEALRAMTMPGPRPVPTVGDEPGGHIGWVTLREASDATGIPVATLRSWIRKKRIPSTLDETPVGNRRLVPLDRVLARARQLGREIDGVVDLRERTEDEPLGMVPVTSGPPPGTMLVPIEAWDKMLLQLGNLHEAGQQLAEARERAARAETEAVFLRERLAEMRNDREEAIEQIPSPPPPDPGPTVTAPAPSFTAYLWRSATSGFRRK